MDILDLTEYIPSDKMINQNTNPYMKQLGLHCRVCGQFFGALL